LVGFIDDDPDKQGKMAVGLPVLGTHADLDALVRQTGASEIIVAITQPDQMHPEMFQAIMDCHERGVPVTQMPVLFEQLTGRVPVEHAGRNLHIVLPLNGYPSRLHTGIKLLFDTAIGVVGLAVTGVLLPFVWLAQRFESAGPVFYTQARVGRGGQPFALIKFRTMVANAESNGPQWAEENDRRITRVGRVMRHLHIDEISHAINIVRGEVSFIGPRPERPEFLAQLEKQIPFYRARHAVKPGVTGWAQIHNGYASSVEDALIKLQYDLYYIKHQSLWLDLVILIKTLGLVLTLRGR
jgi:lipopolysaccharide/colanic/teichoic acid biosynthesis glycosyltransferase